MTMTQLIFFIITGIAIPLVVFASLFVAYYYQMKKRQQEIKERREKLEDSLQKIAGGLEKSCKKDVVDDSIIARMQINLRSIEDYYTWSKRQARNSFMFAAIMCFLGFFLMSITFILALLLDVEIGIAVIPAIGGAISQFVAATALWIYGKSSKQLNHYHAALHEDQRFLFAVDLVNKFEKMAEKEKMLEIIIRETLSLNRDKVLASKD